MSSGRYATSSDTDLIDIIARLERRIKALETPRGGTVASVGAGSIQFLNGTAQIYDASGNLVVAANSSGIGLQTPFLYANNTRESEFITPPVTTTSGTFSRMYRVTSLKFFPKLHIALNLQVDAGSTGEVRFVDVNQVGTVVLSGPLSFTNSTTSQVILEFDLPGAFQSGFIIGVEGRRSAGAGTVRVGVAYSLGRGN